mmetsp:Transcript_33755/g.104218  ORF Transcript_33755/g.104218 Transcript_33755/m.104218 type:complete len:207 (+) Transcript_33755:187-807(+)
MRPSTAARIALACDGAPGAKPMLSLYAISSASVKVSARQSPDASRIARASLSASGVSPKIFVMGKSSLRCAKIQSGSTCSCAIRRFTVVGCSCERDLPTSCWSVGTWAGHGTRRSERGPFFAGAGMSLARPRTPPTADECVGEFSSPVGFATGSGRGPLLAAVGVRGPPGALRRTPPIGERGVVGALARDGVPGALPPLAAEGALT